MRFAIAILVCVCIPFLLAFIVGWIYNGEDDE